MERDSQRATTGLSPVAWTIVLVGAGYLLFGPGPFQAPLQAISKARDVAALYAEYEQLRHQNEGLKRVLEYTKTPEGRELLARGRHHMVREGEYVVRLPQAAEPPEHTERGMRAIIDRMRQSADSTIEAFRVVVRLLKEHRK